MSNIHGLGPTGGVNRILQTAKPAAAAQPAATQATPDRTDKVDLSGTSNVSAMLAKLKANDVRLDKVADIKGQIEAGTYESDDKLNAAIDKLLDDLA